MLIHIKRNAELFGPYSVEEIREYLSDGRLSLSDFAQLPGTTEWNLLGSVPGINNLPPPSVIPRTQCVQPASPLTGSPQQKKRTNDLVSGSVLRDLLIVVGLQAAAVAIISFSAGFAGRRASDASLGLACLFWGIVGFAISGTLATGNRWEHLVKVAGLTTQ